MQILQWHLSMLVYWWYQGLHLRTLLYELFRALNASGRKMIRHCSQTFYSILHLMLLCPEVVIYMWTFCDTLHCIKNWGNNATSNNKSKTRVKYNMKAFNNNKIRSADMMKSLILFQVWKSFSPHRALSGFTIVIDLFLYEFCTFIQWSETWWTIDFCCTCTSEFMYNGRFLWLVQDLLFKHCLEFSDFSIC